MRVSFGAILLCDLFVRATDVRDMYAGGGILAIQSSIDMAGPASWSLHWISGAVWFQQLLIGAAASFAVGMILGWHTRWMVFGSWVMLASLQTRNALVINGGDNMLVVLMFWAIFLPLGSVWSLDARETPRQELCLPFLPVTSITSTCFILQLCFVYWFGGLAKLNQIWLGFNPWVVSLEPSRLWDYSVGGVALERALRYDLYRKPLAELLLAWPALLRSLSLGTLVLELFAPLALFVPVATRWWRLVVIFSFALLHLGIELVLHVGQFSFIALAAWSALLPAMVWDSHYFCRLAGRRVSNEKPQLPPAVTALDGIAAKLLNAVPGFRVVHATTSAILLSLVFAWNVAHILRSDLRRVIQEPLRPIVNATMLRQHWNMFGRPLARESWLVYSAKLQNGEIVDPWQDGQHSAMQCDVRCAKYRNHRWRKLHSNLVSKRYKPQLQETADFIFRRWNERHPDDQQIESLDVYQFHEQPASAAFSRDSESHRCLTIPAYATSQKSAYSNAVGHLPVVY